MDSSEAIELGRESMRIVIMLGGPILLIGLILGLFVGMLQSMTQVHDQTVGFVPKVIGLILAIGLGLPWFSEQMIDYSRELFARPAIAIKPVAEYTKQASQDGSRHGSGPAIATESNAVELVAPELDLPNIDTAEPSHDKLKSPEIPHRNEYPGDRLTNPFQLPQHRLSRLPKNNQDL